jgi:hypothetical protein
MEALGKDPQGTVRQQPSQTSDLLVLLYLQLRQHDAGAELSEILGAGARRPQSEAGAEQGNRHGQREAC